MKLRKTKSENQQENTSTGKRRTWILIVAIPLVLVLAGWGAWEYHETPQFCGNTCHIMEPYVESYQHGDLMAKAHADAGLTCLDCHEPTLEQQINEVVVYVKGEYKDPLKTRKFDNEWCFQCHEHESYEAIAERTEHFVEEVNRNPHESPHYANLECQMCHKSHQLSEVYCNECHDFPAPGPGWEDNPPPQRPTP